MVRFGTDAWGNAPPGSNWGRILRRWVAGATYRVFGNVHLACGNAGVVGGSGIDDISLDTRRWILDVRLMGVLHGIGTFLPHIRAHAEEGHFVNTASIAALNSGLGLSPYAASKFRWQIGCLPSRTRPNGARAHDRRRPGAHRHPRERTLRIYTYRDQVADRGLRTVRRNFEGHG